MIYPKGAECINLRFDVVSFEPKEKNAGLTSGYDWVIRSSREKNEKLEFINDKAVSLEEKTTVEVGTDLIMKYWTIGPHDNRVIVMSATIIKSNENMAITAEILDSAFGQWMNNDSQSKETVENVSNGLGVLFGDIMVADFKMEWIG